MNRTITVCIPTSFENKYFLMELLKSISRQEMLPDETLIVINSKKLLKQSFLDSIDNFRKNIPINLNHKLVYAKKVGLSHARNLGIENCKTDILIFGDDDDLWDKKKIYLINKEIEKNGICLVRHNFDLLYKKDVKESHLKYKFEPNLLLIGISNFAGGGSTISGSLCIFKTLNFNEKLLSGEDWDFWLRAYLSKVKIITISKVLVTYRIHQKRMTKNILKIFVYEFLIRIDLLINLFKIIVGLIIGLLNSLIKISVFILRRFFKTIFK